MSGLADVVEAIRRAHNGVIEAALRAALVRFGSLDRLTVVDVRATPANVLARTEVRGDGEWIVYVVETTRDGDGYTTRGWVP